MHFRNLLMEQARIDHAPNGSLVTYITSADALVHKLESKVEKKSQHGQMVGRGTTSMTTMQIARQARGTSLDLERVCYVIQSK